MRSVILVLFTVIFGTLVARAQSDSTTARSFADTAFTAADTTAAVKAVADTLPPGIRFPDSLRHNSYVDTLLKRYAFNPLDFSHFRVRHEGRRLGNDRPSRNTWVVFVILALLIYAGLVNRLLSKDVYNVVQAFYLRSAFTKLSKEDNLLTSWAFIGLFILFGFTLGLYIYQVSVYKDMSYSLHGFQLYIACSVLVIVLFVLKIIVLRIIGFIFDIQKLLRDYISIIYLTYFNVAFIFLPVVICFCLFSVSLTPYLLKVSGAIIAIIVLIQYGRSILNVISNFTFPKIYLFIYLCALEICPILILIKAFNL